MAGLSEAVALVGVVLAWGLAFAVLVWVPILEERRCEVFLDVLPCFYGVCGANNVKSVDDGYSYIDVICFLGVAKKRLNSRGRKI